MLLIVKLHYITWGLNYFTDKVEVLLDCVAVFFLVCLSPFKNMKIYRWDIIFFFFLYIYIGKFTHVSIGF